MYDQATLLASTNSARSLQLIDSILILSPQSELALKALLLQSDVLRTDKKFQQALSSLQRITPFTRQKKFSAYAGDVLFTKGSIYKDLLNDSAQMYFEEAYTIFRLSKDSLQMAQCLNRISFIQMEKGNYLAAMDYLNKVDQLTPPSAILKRLDLLINQAHTFISVGLNNRAVALSKKTMSIIQQLSRLELNSRALPAFGNICDAYLQMGKPDSAQYYAQKAINTLDSIPLNSPFWITLANISLELDSPTVALNYLKQYQVKPNFKLYFLQKQSTLLRVYQKLNDTSNANRVAREIITNIPSIPRIVATMRIYRIVESAYSQLGDQPMAYAYLQKYFDVYQQVYNQKQVSDLLDKDFEQVLTQQRKQSELEENLLKATIANHRQQQWALIIGSVLLLVIIGLLWFRYRYLKQFNMRLNKMVDDRTHELSIKNQQLSEYAFINAHKLRAPVARIMGLLHVYQMKNSDVSAETLMNLLANETQSLDGIIRSITEAIEEKRVFDRNDL
jgi:tetratricopeptide (TPR) repeat protein